MTNNVPLLLTPTELLDIYGVPVLTNIERQEYFTLSESEIKILKKFTDPKDAVYFAISLVFFKIKQTFVDFTYRETTPERQHVMNRYLSHQVSPKSLPSDRRKSRIKNKILTLCEYQRFTGKIQEQITLELQESALHHPRQRQLCKELLNSFVKHRVAIPGYTTLQDVVSKVSNKENTHVTRSYLRHTNKKQRAIVLSLLEKVDNLHHIINIKKDMKSFKSKDLWTEIEKQGQLKEIFEIAREVVSKLDLPTATVSYYANLVQYYNGPGLKQINRHAAGLYLLCYTYTRYQVINDNLLDAFKKRTLEYKKKATDYAKDQALSHLEEIRNVREQASKVLIAIKNFPSPYIPKEIIHVHIPEEKLLPSAELLVDDHFNKDLSFWKYIDDVSESIKVNIRKLFLSLNFIVSNKETLNKVVAHVKENLLKGTLASSPLPSYIKAWITKDTYSPYIIVNNVVLYNRLEFLLYLRIVHHLGTNNITLQHSIKHKKIEDELLDQKRWAKEKKTILKSLDYPKLLSPIRNTLTEKKSVLGTLYKTVNDAIESGENKFVKTKLNKKGERVWRLSPLEAAPDPNEGFLTSLQQRSIVDVMRFVNDKTGFYRAFNTILPKSKKGAPDTEAIAACILANAIRLGSRKMATISDLTESALVTTEASFLRLETLLPAIDKINNAVASLPIYKEWYINSLLHGSMDGLKLETRLKNVKARYSSKYFGSGTGVSAYNEIVNSLSVAGRLIGANEYEGNFAFEMVHHQNTSLIKPTHVSTDKHGMNSINFALFDFTDLIFCPRIPKLHQETLWGFGSPKDYEGFLIKPTKFADENLMVEEEDNIRRLVASLLTGDALPSVLIRKLSLKEYSSRTKKALVQYNNIIRSGFILNYLHNFEFRRAIMYALNRGEGYNSLYRAIALLNNGSFRGKSEIEMEVWHQCTRLVSSILHYYNTYILNSFYVNSTDEKEKRFLASFSPTAREHVNFLGHYQFYAKFEENWLEKLLAQWDWKKHMDFGKKS